MPRSSSSFVILFFLLFAAAVSRVHTLCTDPSPAPTDTCIGQNATPGACCLTNALCATPTSVVNTNPPFATDILPGTAAAYADMNLTGTANYPLLYYALVGQTLGSYTYEPYNPVLVSMGRPSSPTSPSFIVMSAWAGYYTFTFQTPYCNATNSSLYFTRQLYLRSKTSANDNTGRLLCDASPTASGYSRCDCSIVACFAGYYQSGACSQLYPSCNSACADVLSPKPVSFTIGAPFGSGTNVCTSLSGSSCTCAAKCKDNITDTNEYCDVGATSGLLGSCCTTDCMAPNSVVPAAASYTYASCTNVITLSTIQMNVAAQNPNFAVNIEFVSVTGVPGLNVTSLTTTTMTLNSRYTGTAVFTFRTLFCAATSTYISFVRTVSMTACCNNSNIDLGENCDLGGAGNGAAGSCCTSQCTYGLNTQVCRAAVSHGANGTCDLPEYCTGMSPVCPNDSYASAGSTCGTPVSPNGCLDSARCLGNSTICPAPILFTAGTECGSDRHGVCASTPVCNGFNATCPSIVYYNSSTVCRAPTDLCDAPEFCSGTSSSCPADVKRPNGYPCRASTGFCDIAEVCNGASNACPADTFKPNTVICRNSTGLCDPQEYCAGTSATCPADFLAAPGTICRAATGGCDIAETCDGTTNTCPADQYATSGTVCRASAGGCDIAETCDGETNTCPADAFQPSSFMCRFPAGTCDTPEYCTGTAASCPVDAVLPINTVCNAAAGICQNDAVCNGVAVICPSNTYKSALTVCRASLGPCDITEYCTGDSEICPANALQLPTYACSPSLGPCMPSSFCNGTSVLCNVLPYYNTSVLCRPAVSTCDVDDYCPGNSYSCSSDVIRSAGYTCAASTDPCQFDSTCTGLTTACTPSYAPLNSVCHVDTNFCYSDQCLAGPGGSTVCTRGALINYDDGLYCNGIETCNPSTGNKVAGTPVTCNDATSCTTDACSNALAMCVYTPVANSVGPCGSSVGACRPGNYTCDGSLPTPVINCVGAITPVAEICYDGIDNNCNGVVDEFCDVVPCNVTDDCYDVFTPNDCVTIACTVGECTSTVVAFGVQCDDGIRCTTHDQCDGLGVCEGIPLICNDFNECTNDYCDEEHGWCVFDGTAFEDSPCTSTDQCSINSACDNQGRCVPVTTADCTIYETSCAHAVCDGESGECGNAPFTGPWCDDGDACTFNDVCTEGGCVGSPVDCNDYNDCTDDTCHSPDGACVHTIVDDHCFLDGNCYPDGYVYPYMPFAPCWSCDVNTSTITWTYTGEASSCDDDDLCTYDDHCDMSTGMCIGTPMDCSYLDSPCSTGQCYFGECYSAATNVGTPCDDGLFCTINDACNNGGQCSGETRECGGFDGSCNLVYCDEGTDTCANDPIADYTRCPMFTSVCDGEAYCLSGVCTPADPMECTPSPNVCIDVECDSQYGCIEIPLYETACNDSNVCTIGDFCGGDSVCYPGYLTLNCDDGDPCTNDVCDAELGCINTPVDSCTSCTQNLDCTVQSCQIALCVDNQCMYIAESVGTRCSDGNACNGEEFCTGNGVCISILLPTCDDDNECTEDTCDELFGCVFTPLTGNMCDDGDPGTQYDQCTAGVCAGIPIPCPDDTHCLSYTRQLIGGFPQCVGVPVNVNGSCSVGDPCLVGGVCSSYGECINHDLICPMPGECVSSYECVNGTCIPDYYDASVQCNTQNKCGLSFCNGAGDCEFAIDTEVNCYPAGECQTWGQCVPETGQCAPVFLEDYDDCLYSDGYCMKGACITTTFLPTPPSSQCEAPSHYDVISQTTEQFDLPDNSPCTDSTVCTSTSYCISGSCAGINTVECDAYEDNVCFVSYCDPDYGCLYEFNDGADCDDDDACTLNTTCNSGICGEATPRNCYNEYFCGVSYCSPDYGCLFSMDSDCRECTIDCDCPYHPCKKGYCDAGVCAYDTDDRALEGCDDGIYCNGQERCEMGSCFLDRPVDCDDQNDCTEDACDYENDQCMYTYTNSNQPCENGDLCAIAAYCDSEGHCLTTSSYNCDTSNPCRVSVGCNPELGVCEYVTLDNGVPCASEDLCSVASECYFGQCVSVQQKDCTSYDWCQSPGSCNPATGDCVFEQTLVDYACSDGNWCTLGDMCDGFGTCIPGMASPCDSMLIDWQCQARNCDPVEQSCTVIDLDGHACSTGLPMGPCSGPDVCSLGTCVRTYNTGMICREADLTGCDVLDVCVDGNDFCPEDARLPDGTQCQDELFCYTNTCQEGRCIIDQARDCSAYNTECTEAYCDEAAKQCTYRNLPNGLPCSGTEYGQCVSYSACYYGSCQTYYADAYTSCNDGNICTYNDHCSGYDNSCASGPVLNCSAIDSPCSRGECNPLTGQCFTQNGVDDDSCNADDDPCTVDDTCFLGVCVPGAPLNCSYLDTDCQYGMCAGGECVAVVTSQACNPNLCQGNCTAPFDWWAVHNSHCAGTLQFTWPAHLETTKICGSSYYTWSQLRQGAFAWRFLFNQWLAATLNAANGACMPNTTIPLVAQSYALLSQCNTELLLTNTSSIDYKTLATSLYSYNTGAFGPGLCNPVGCGIPPYLDTTCLFEGTRNQNTTGDGSCINGLWNEGLLSCDCYIGWSGSSCTLCATPTDTSFTYVCVPSFNNPWAYTLRAVDNKKLGNYIGDSKKAYKIVQMTGRAAVYPGTGGLDCSCRDPTNSGTNVVRYYNMTVGEDDIQVYIAAISSDLDLCAEFFEVTVSNNGASCSIDGVFCEGDGDDSWKDICDCCREDDDDCACPHNDPTCLRNHLINQAALSDKYLTVIIIVSVIGGIAVAVFMFYLLMSCMSTSPSDDIASLDIGAKLPSAKKPRTVVEEQPLLPSLRQRPTPKSKPFTKIV